MKTYRALALSTLIVLIACGGELGEPTDAGADDSDISSPADSDVSRDSDAPSTPDSDTSHDADSPTSDGHVDGGADATVDSDVPWTRPPRADVSSPPASASWRYGGGVGYPDRVAPDWPIATVVSTRAELEAALETALAGDVVYVDDDAAIDLTGASLCIPGGVWLASGRGHDGSAGGLLYTTETVRAALFNACGDDVRVTGLRILGADASQCPPTYPDACSGEDRTGGVNCRDCEPTSNGIETNGVDRLEVDNCELAGWSSAAIRLRDSIDNHAHHNHIHHTQRQGLGYGLVIMRGGDGDVSVLIEWNRFNYNRHAVAGSGEPGQDYEARHNLVLPHANGHVFDMHGENENTDNGSELAGGEIVIHDNTVLVADQYSMVIRGRPDHGAWLYDNCLSRSSASTAALQRFFFGNFHVDESPTGAAPNTYGRSAADCESLRFCTSAGAIAPWQYAASSSYGIGSLRFGDFDGDGRTDVFRADGEAWFWLSAGTGSWTRLNTSSIGTDSLGFGDFDGDGRTDAFRATGSEWRISSGGSSSWTALRSAADTLDSIAFGDFDGDGRTDVFRTTGSEWQWSRSGTAAWARRNASVNTLSSLAFGDFDGDGATDVFNATGSEWRFSAGGSSPWDVIGTSSYRLGSLALADVDGDGTTDVMRSNGDEWFVSWGARSRWERLRIISHGLDEVAFGDFDGDGADDAFRTGCL